MKKSYSELLALIKATGIIEFQEVWLKDSFDEVSNELFIDFQYVFMKGIESANSMVEDGCIQIIEQMLHHKDFVYFLETDIIWDILNLEGIDNNIFERKPINKSLQAYYREFLIYWKTLEFE